MHECIRTHNKRINGINRHRLGNKKCILYEDYRRNTGTKNENDVAFLRNKQQQQQKKKQRRLRMLDDDEVE